MRKYPSREELIERCQDPRFCVMCLKNRDYVEVDDHICEECQNDPNTMPRRLPKVTLKNGKTYYVDERLRQLRNVENPHDYIDSLIR